MKHLPFGLGLVLLCCLIAAPASTQAASNCGLSSPALCETFDASAGTGNRAGQLNGVLWGESHTTGNQNFSSPAFGWFSSTQNVCGMSQDVTPDHDAYICNGQLVEGQNDGGMVTAITLYPKQPFDFAGRTGKITFDVSNDSQGSHAAWPELWVTDQPIPEPFAHEDTLKALPRNGFGIRFAGFAPGTCPEGNGYVGVDSAITVANYVENDSFNGGNLNLQALDCVKESNGTGASMNHYELDVSQSQIDVYATDAGTTSPLKHIASIPGANLNFTRGVVWIEDAHYNGNKFNSQGVHAFTWDNVGFDGPVLPRDLSYDVLDHGMPDLGWFVQANTPQSFTLNNMASPSTAVGSLLMFSFWAETAPISFDYTLNGHQHTYAWPYPDTDSFTPKTMAIPLGLSDLQAGTNTFSISPSASLNLANVNIVLLGAGGGGATTQATAAATPVATQTASPTPQPATPTPSATPVALSQVLAQGQSDQVTCSSGTLATISQSSTSEVIACQ